VITLTIDDQKVVAEEGMTILEAAREHGIYIPTLCYHEALKPYGACRLCIVEFADERRGARLVSSCSFPAQDGAVIRTNSPLVLEARRMIIELLLADCPDVKAVRELADELGVEKSQFEPEGEGNDCILCGLCPSRSHPVFASAAAPASLSVPPGPSHWRISAGPGWRTSGIRSSRPGRAASAAIITWFPNQFPTTRSYWLRKSLHKLEGDQQGRVIQFSPSSQPSPLGEREPTPLAHFPPKVGGD